MINFSLNEHTRAVTVTVNNVIYAFKVFRSNKEITYDQDWTEIAAEVAKIALKLINKKKLKKASITLKGLNENLTQENRVSLASASIKPLKKSKKIFPEYASNEDPKHINPYLEKIQKLYYKTSSQELNQEPEKRSPEISTIPTHPGSMCLDDSLAHYFYPKEGEKRSLAYRELVTGALKNDTDPENIYLPYLIESIKNIPQDQRGSLDEILNKEASSITQEELIELRHFYANHISARTEEGKMKHKLDKVFLYFVPRINSAYKIALIDQERILERFPENMELTLENWAFIHYDQKEQHFEPVDKNNRETCEKLERMMQEKKAEIFEAFKQRVHSEDATPESIKKELWCQLKLQHSQAFNECAEKIYLYDLENKEIPEVEQLERAESNRHYPRYGKDVYSQTEYGEWRLANIDPTTLKSRLQTFF